MSETATATQTGESWGLNRRTAAAVFGLAFLLIGALGPVVAGPRGDLVVFGRNYLHDAVHLTSGLLGIGAALYEAGRYARTYLVGFGVAYLLVLVTSLLFPDLMNEVFAIDAADNALHAALTLGLLGAGYGLSDRA